MPPMAKKVGGAAFVATLEKNDGQLHVDAPTARIRRRYRQLIHAAITGGHLPAGKKLTYSG